MIDTNTRASIAHILLALINADNVIDQGEIIAFKKLKDEYGINHKDILYSDAMTFAQAAQNLLEYAKSKNDDKFLYEFYSDAKSMTTSDGLCAQSEARLLYALKCIFFNNERNEIRLVACKENTIQIDGPKVFFVREEQHTELSNEFKGYFQEYYYEFLNYGFELINVAAICDELVKMGEDNIVELMSIGRPDIIRPRAISIYKELQQIKPQMVFEEIIGGSLDICHDKTTTYFLIKICDSVVTRNNTTEKYYNFIRVPVASDKGMKDVVRSIVKEYSECSAHLNPIILPADFNKFRYFSFTKSLFKMLEGVVERNENGLKRIIIDAENQTILLDGVIPEGIRAPYKEVALFMLICWLSAKNGLLIITNNKDYQDNSTEEYVAEWVSLAKDKYSQIQRKLMPGNKLYENPGNILSQDLTKIKQIIKTHLHKWDKVYNMCRPQSYERTIHSEKTNRDYTISGYMVKLPSSLIFAKLDGKVKGKEKEKREEKLIPIEDIFN